MEISIGNKIELVLLDQIIKNDRNKKVYISKVYDFIDDNVLQIAMPIHEGKIVPLPVGERYSACFYTDKGLLACNVVIKSRYKSGNLFYLEVLMLGELTKVQRREYYRYPCILDASMRIISEREFETGVPDDISIPEEALEYPVKILDISGGGTRIASKHDADSGAYVKIKFTIRTMSENMRFNLFAHMLESTQIKDRRDLFEQRLEFLRIKQEERDRIIRYIFESERMARKREIGG